MGSAQFYNQKEKGHYNLGYEGCGHTVFARGKITISIGSKTASCIKTLVAAGNQVKDACAEYPA